VTNAQSQMQVSYHLSNLISERQTYVDIMTIVFCMYYPVVVLVMIPPLHSTRVQSKLTITNYQMPDPIHLIEYLLHPI
jgi:hypothetical protein